MVAMNILVIGMAKTGTTVISKALQHSLSDAHYHLEPKHIGIFERDYPPGESHVVKILFEHWTERPHLRDAILFGETRLKFDKQVAIVRDARDELISRLFYIARPLAVQGVDREKMDRWIDFLRKKESHPQSVSVSEMIAELNRIFGTKFGPRPQGDISYVRWLKRLGDRIHVLKYEDFIEGRLDGLSHYLGIPISDRRDVAELGYTRRSSAASNWKRMFTEEDVRILKPVYKELLEQTGYANWDLEPQDSLDAASGSEYVRRITEEVFRRQAAQ
jgi:hypothetical protein